VEATPEEDRTGDTVTDPPAKKLGLIVNPLAGLGGRVGLKGSDGLETVRQALLLGAEPTSPARAVETLRQISSIKQEIELFTYPVEMGEDEARRAGFDPAVLGSVTSGQTTADDTRRAAKELASLGVGLLLFVGGDGTARDIYEAIGTSVPCLGIPAGVKIHSSVYAISPRRAADLVREHLLGRAQTRQMEVMDVDEDLFRNGRVSARLYGYLRVPFERQLLQAAKAVSRANDEDLPGIAAHVIDSMDDETYYILGPGSTTKAIGDALGIDKTTLGVDVVSRKRLLVKDASEEQILRAIDGRRAVIVVTAIGGQGFIFGRGNQQISPRVINQVGKERIVVVATQSKLLALDGPLLVDTGDADCDRSLRGYVRVITGYDAISIWKVAL
jgi:predicted polyphosphate/ATP-dependent NAD kinase